MRLFCLNVIRTLCWHSPAFCTSVVCPDFPIDSPPKKTCGQHCYLPTNIHFPFLSTRESLLFVFMRSIMSNGKLDFPRLQRPDSKINNRVLEKDTPSRIIKAESSEEKYLAFCPSFPSFFLLGIWTGCLEIQQPFCNHKKRSEEESRVEGGGVVPGGTVEILLVWTPAWDK